jgi:serine/threonine protein kinase
MLLKSENGSNEYVVKRYGEKAQIFKTTDEQHVIKLFNDENEYNNQVDLFERLSNFADAGEYILLPLERVINIQTQKRGFVFKSYMSDLEVPGNVVNWKLTTILEFAEKIAKSLYFLHDKVGICHGDFHSGNVVMNDSIESCRLIDITHGMSRYNAMSEPPEQLILTIKSATPTERLVYAFQRDVWSFAIFLIQQISGKKIFERLDYEEVDDATESSDSGNSEDWDTFGCNDELYALNQLNTIQCYFELSQAQNDIMHKRRSHWKSVFEGNFANGLNAHTDVESNVAKQFCDMVLINMCEPDPDKRISMSKVVGILNQMRSELDLK